MKQSKFSNTLEASVQNFHLFEEEFSIKLLSVFFDFIVAPKAKHAAMMVGKMEDFFCSRFKQI